MSLSRKLIQTLVKQQVESNVEAFGSLDKTKLLELAGQAFLIQVTHPDPKTVKKGLQDKIEHFNAVMSDK